MSTRLVPQQLRGTAGKPLTVDAITRHIKGLLEATFSGVWVEGEITQVKQHHSGHVYLTLSHGDARLDGMVWASEARRMRYQPGPGERVVAFGHLSVWPPSGGYRLVVQRLQPAGAGARQAALAALKATLASEGLLDPSRKRPLPRLPRAVGVVTSGSGAARRDIEAVLHRRSPQIPIYLASAKVQGEGAARAIADALRAVVREPDVQVVIVGRGGGSMDDLWAFNEEAVARAIAACPVPVISAVGHETDTTLADLVADHRAATPSEAAERAVPVRDDLLADIAGLVDRLDRALSRRQVDGQHRLAALRARLERGVDGRDRRRLIEQALGRLATAVARRQRQADTRLRRLEARLSARHPATRAATARRRLDALTHRLDALAPRLTLHARRRLDGARTVLRPPPAALGPKRARLATLAARLSDLSPLAVLGRGYALATDGEGRVLRHAEQVQPTQQIEVRLAHGRLTATVDATHLPSEAS